MTHTQTFQRPIQQRRTDALLARLRAASLDVQLAAGDSPDAGRLRAVRAAMLVTPQSRESLAAWWVQVVSRARQQQPTVTRVAVASSRILAAEAAIRDLVDALQSGEPVAARGVAEALLLLRDGSGPVYSLRSRMDLATAVRVAHRHLGTQRSSCAIAA